jgi:rare lipoprotein A
VTRRTATLLRFPGDAAVRVRLEVLPAESHTAVDAVPGAPQLELTAAPRGEVRETDLAPPAGTAPSSTRPRIAPPQEATPVPAQVAPLPESVAQGVPAPGQLFIRLGTFQNYEYANIQRTRVGGLGANIVSTRNGRTQTHRVIIGPLPSVQRADLVLDQVLRSGVTDARIVVE